MRSEREKKNKTSQRNCKFTEIRLPARQYRKNGTKQKRTRLMTLNCP